MVIVKIGGGERINLAGIASDLAELQEQFIVVHGANALRDRLAKDLGKEKKVLTSASGYSSVFSDETALDLILMAYAGLRNKRIVELLQQHGLNAIGLTGLDGRVVEGRRNQGIRVREDRKLHIVRDYSGKPKAVNRPLLDWLLENAYVPVLTIPIIDENKVAINSENDDIVNILQSNLQADTIIQLIEAPGFLADKDDPSSKVAKMSRDELRAREEQVEGRMKRKMLALGRLFENGAKRVLIADGRSENPIKAALNGEGTVIE